MQFCLTEKGDREMENKKVSVLSEDDRDMILRMLSWDASTDSPLANLLLDAAKGKVPSLWTIQGLVERIQKRDQEIITKVEGFLDERYDFMKNAEDEKEAANF